MKKEKRCYKCEYFEEFELSYDYDGRCTRYPEWINVGSLHHCGEFKECAEDE